MKIVKFPDSYMRNDGKDNRYHYYAVYINRNTKKYNAIALTHISRPDYSREKKIEEGKLLPIRLKALNKYSDSGITKYIYSTANQGKEIDITQGIIVLDSVSSYSEKKIKGFASDNAQFVSYRINKRKNKHKKIRR